MSSAAPEPVSSNPLRMLARDWRADRRAKAPFPPGATRPSIRRTHRIIVDPLSLLLESYARYGPVSTLRIGHVRHVLLLGPEANHHILVAHAENYSYRHGGLALLIPLLGDAILTSDGEFHRHSQRILLPAFHREAIAAAHTVMRAETERALATWEPGATVDVYPWVRRLTLRIAMRAFGGFDPDAHAPAVDATGEVMRAVAFYGNEYWVQMLRGPGTPFARLMATRRRLDELLLAEIARRRADGSGDDVLSMLIAADDEDGNPLPDRRVRDETMTLLAASLGVATTVTFLLYELARHPDWRSRLGAELAAHGRDPSAADLMRTELPLLGMAVEETLRLYPSAWLGVRRSVEECSVGGMTVPAGVPVTFSAWASHHLPDVWEEPNAFRPERFAPENRARIPRGAYVPFGLGSRMCLGRRFAELTIRTIVAGVLRDFRPELTPGYRMTIRPRFFLEPAGGLPMIAARH